MADVNRNLTFECDSGMVTIDVVVGEGQTGGITIYRDGTKVDEGADALRQVELGTCESLADATITIRATVNGVNPQSGRTSLASTIPAGSQQEPDITPGPEVALGEPVRFKVVYTRRGE